MRKSARKEKKEEKEEKKPGQVSAKLKSPIGTPVGTIVTDIYEEATPARILKAPFKPGERKEKKPAKKRGRKNEPKFSE